MAEIKRDPVTLINKATGEEWICFDEDHTLSDIARWILNGNPVDAGELIRLLTTGKDSL